MKPRRDTIMAGDKAPSLAECREFISKRHEQDIQDHVRCGRGTRLIGLAPPLYRPLPSQHWSWETYAMSRLVLSTLGEAAFLALSKTRRGPPNKHLLLSRKKTTSAVPFTADRFNIKRGDYAQVIIINHKRSWCDVMSVDDFPKYFKINTEAMDKYKVQMYISFPLTVTIRMSWVLHRAWS